MLPKINFWTKKKYVMDIRLFLLILSITNQVELRPTTKALDQLAGGQMEWEAWLLIHESRPKSGDEMLKRITPKSIFTVRPFSPDILPPCAEGYRSDSMGRCVNVVKINSESHLGYLVEKLNSMYDSEDYEDDEVEDDEPTTGPLQFSIPFGETDESTHNHTKGPLNIINDFNISETEIANFKLIGHNFTNFTNPLNVIPLPKDVIKNFTSTANINQNTDRRTEPEANTTVLSFLDSLIHPDQSVTQDSSPINHDTAKHNITNVAPQKDEVEDDNSETIIILFHPLPNATSQNKTLVAPGEPSSTKQDRTTTTEAEHGIDSSTEKMIAKTSSNTVILTQSNIYPEDTHTVDVIDDDEFGRNKMFSFLHNADYKAAFFQSLLNKTSNPITAKQQTTNHSTPIVVNDSATKNQTNTTTDDIVSLLRTIAKIDTTPETLPRVKQQDVTVDFNHRNRDRNIFWSNANVAGPGLATTSERVNSKYYASPVFAHSHHHHGIFRKTVQDSTDQVINTRRWSNR